MRREKLSEAELNSFLEKINGWKFAEDQIKTRRKFENFAEALVFVNKVGELAEAADHHPDITFGWGYAEFRTMTHDRGGITDVDFALVKEIDAIESEH